MVLSAEQQLQSISLDNILKDSNPLLHQRLRIGGLKSNKYLDQLFANVFFLRISFMNSIHVGGETNIYFPYFFIRKKVKTNVYLR